MIAVPTPRERSQCKSDQLTQATGKEILDHLTPELQEHMDPVVLLPYLQCHALVSLADVNYIRNPHWTVVNRTLRILECVSSRGPNALKRFVQFLSEGTEHIGHAYLAGRLHEAMKERCYEGHIDIEVIDQVGIGNKHCALQDVTRPAISMQQAHWQCIRSRRNSSFQQKNANRPSLQWTTSVLSMGNSEFQEQSLEKVQEEWDKEIPVVPLHAVRDGSFGTVIMDFSFNSSTRTRQAKRSTLSSVQPHLLLEPIDQQVAAASPLVSVCWI